MTHNDPPLDRAAAIDALAAEPLNAIDVDLITRIAAVYDTVDPMPADLIERLQFQLTLDLLHAELAELQHLPAGQLAGARSDPDEVRSMTFTSDSRTTMITVSASSPDRVRVDGWVAPGGGVTVELRQVTASLATTADEDGRFSFDGVEHGLTRFVVTDPDDNEHPPVVTPAVEI